MTATLHVSITLCCFLVAGLLSGHLPSAGIVGELSWIGAAISGFVAIAGLDAELN